ncbi:MAG: HlyC/CorC family transporter [Geodermatophilaceae bacterium]|nr:HlyC/CorC family transporter [Geodermatophilaceae bacterium]
MTIALDVVLVVVFILIGGLFVAAEISLITLREGQLRSLAERGRRGGRLARLMADPKRFLGAGQIGVTLAGFLAAAFGAATLAEPFASWLTDRGLTPGPARAIAVVLITVIITYVSLVLGQLAPKRLALQRAERLALVVAGPLDRIATLLRPVIRLLSTSTHVVIRIFGGDPRIRGEAISQEELRDLVAAHESLTSDERTMIDEVFAAGQRQISEVMIPRTEVDFLEAGLTVSRAGRQVADSPHSRYPVVGRSQDDVLGFVHIRDLLTPSHPAGRAATVGDVAREVTQLPGSKKVLAALSEMRRSGHHLAIVVDEYGGTDGIVTLEDLIEEVIGEIRDEYDEAIDEPRHSPSGEIEVDGLLNLDDFAEATGLELPEGPYETAAGFVLSRLGQLPVLGDSVRIDGRSLDVLELDGRRIARLRLGPAESGASVTSGSG